ncbi:ATP-binding cassette domain-containing protein [Streptomyces olivaceoviridis]|uniref:ATP-binding cassette domain-containing protein n=1 Tax=Streptomyces olivaceoviridis TaxID=1921 RepID=UPI0033BDCF4D
MRATRWWPGDEADVRAGWAPSAGRGTGLGRRGPTRLRRPGLRRRPPVHALREVDPTARRGEHLSVVGPSGSGKSTLLNILGLLDRPCSDAYWLDGVRTDGLAGPERTAPRGSRIGFVSQCFPLPPYRTVDENVMLAEPSTCSVRRAGAAGDHDDPLRGRSRTRPAQDTSGHRRPTPVAAPRSPPYRSAFRSTGRGDCGRRTRRRS